VSDEVFAAALRGLYSTFDAPPPMGIEGCPCCIGSRKVDVLVTKPLRTLSTDDLARYGSGAFLTVGGVNDFRYLLPRLFELSASDPGWYPSPEVIVGKLALAEWTTWRKAERIAVTNFLSAWFDRLAPGWTEEDEYLGDIDPLLCGLARAGEDIAPYLGRLHRPENINGLAQLRETWDDDRATAFWDIAPGAWQQVSDFLAANHPSTNTGPQAT
jgi:hypothetical protein